MIAQFTVEFGINSTCNALNSIRLRLMLFRALLVLLIPNSTVNCAITYTNYDTINDCILEFAASTRELLYSVDKVSQSFHRTKTVYQTISSYLGNMLCMYMTYG